MDVVYVKHDKSKIKYLNRDKHSSPPTETRESFLARMKNKFSLSPEIILDDLKK